MAAGASSSLTDAVGKPLPVDALLKLLSLLEMAHPAGFDRGPAEWRGARQGNLVGVTVADATVGRGFIPLLSLLAVHARHGLVRDERVARVAGQ